MQITLTTALITEASVVLAGCIAIGAFLYRIIKWVQRQEKQSVEIAKIFGELETLSFAVMACLDGLKQQGCDGRVTTAYERLEAKLNENAHETEVYKK